MARPALTLRVALGIAATMALASAASCADVLGIESDRHVVTTASDASAPPLRDASDERPVDAPAEVSDASTEASSRPAGWACLDQPVPVAPTGDVQLQLLLNDVLKAKTSGSTGPPVVGASIHACDKLDVTCQSPFGGVVSDDAGIALLTLPGGFDGYYEVSAASYLPSVLARTPMLASEFQPQGVPSAALISSAGVLAGVNQDTSLGFGVVSVIDCDTHVAGGIELTVGAPGPTEQLVYLEGNLPTQGPTATDDISGSALIFNMPAGTLTVSARFADTHAPIRTVTTIARNGWVTFVQIRPDQATRQPLRP